MKEVEEREDGGLRQYAEPEGWFGCDGVDVVPDKLPAAALHGRYRVPKGLPQNLHPTPSRRHPHGLFIILTITARSKYCESISTTASVLPSLAIHTPHRFRGIAEV